MGNIYIQITTNLTNLLANYLLTYLLTLHKKYQTNNIYISYLFHLFFGLCSFNFRLTFFN